MGSRKRTHSAPMHPAIKRYEHGHIVSIVSDEHDYLDWPCNTGGTRRAYIGEEWVYKVPRSDGWCNPRWGLEQNELEASIYQDMVDGVEVRVPVAECYLLPDGVLKMRRVHTVNNIVGVADTPREEYLEMHLPTWVNYVDSDQVGYLEGELVAYDV